MAALSRRCRGAFPFCATAPLVAGQRTLVFSSLAWLVPPPLSLSSTLPLEPGSFIMDFGAWANFLIAISAFVPAEQQVELGLKPYLSCLTSPDTDMQTGSADPTSNIA